MLDYKVCIVTVTYGNRWRFLEQVIKRTSSFNEIINIVVVDNASDQELPVTDKKVIVLNNTDNKGSAGGYKQGIEYAYNNLGCDFIWLLDDDNLPNEDCLTKLLKHWNIIPGAADRKALFCLRADRTTHISIAKGENSHRYYLVPNNFLGFSVSRIFYNQYQKLFGKPDDNAAYREYVIMPYVPYGGLLLHKDMITVIGLPNEDFYLYVDDSEYSYRITQHGGIIWLIPDCRVIDIDKSQGINYKKRPFHSQLLDEWSFRTYYHIRNRMYFYSQVAMRNKFMFGINKILYLTWLKIISVLSLKRDEYAKLLTAVNEGIKGKLGKANPNKF